MSGPRFIKLHAEDNVGIALDDLAIGETAVDGVVLTTSVAKGHKFTLVPVAKGALVRRYGQVIGSASEDIPAGAYVHVHNLAMAEQSLDYAIGSAVVPVQAPKAERTFMG